MQEAASPFQIHVFVCNNDRRGASKSCADGGGQTIKDHLKAEIEKRGWKPRVRVSQSGCLGLCQKGPNVIIHPQGIWFSGVTLADAGAILERIGSLLG